MKIRIANEGHCDGMVTVECDDVEAAIHDQSIEGTHWEAPRDLDIAYAVIMDRPGLLASLRAEGYEVDDEWYVEPTAEEFAALAAQLED